MDRLDWWQIAGMAVAFAYVQWHVDRIIGHLKSIDHSLRDLSVRFAPTRLDVELQAAEDERSRVS